MLSEHLAVSANGPLQSASTAPHVARRDYLAGVETAVFDLVFQSCSPEECAQWLEIPLEWAAARGDYGLVTRLMGAGAPVGGALFRAVERGLGQMVEHIVEHAGVAREFAGGNRGGKVITPLHLAAEMGHEVIVRSLLRSGADKDGLESENRTPLHLAARRGHLAVAEALMDAGASVNLRDAYGETVLAAAARYNHDDVVRAIVRHGADVNDREKAHEITANPLVTKRDEALAAQALLEVGAIGRLRGWKANHRKAEHAEVAQEFVGGDKGDEGNTPLHVAAEMGHEDIVRSLLQSGADRNGRGEKNRTPLHLAARRGHLAVAEALMDAGASVNSRDAYGETVLASAVRHGHADVVRAIVRHGADANNREETSGIAALHLVANGDDAEVAEALLEVGAYPDLLSKGGGAPLHFAVRRGSLRVLSALLRGGADVNAKDEEGRTPLHHATVAAGKIGTALCVDLLLRSGADETAETKTGGVTPADMIGRGVLEDMRVEADCRRVRELLANAPKDKAWRRRMPFVISRSRPGRARLAGDSGRQASLFGSQISHSGGSSSRSGDSGRSSSSTRAKAARKEAEWSWDGQARVDGDTAAAEISLPQDEGEADAGLRSWEAMVVELNNEDVFRNIVLFL